MSSPSELFCNISKRHRLTQITYLKDLTSLRTSKGDLQTSTNLFPHYLTGLVSIKISLLAALKHNGAVLLNICSSIH